MRRFAQILTLFMVAVLSAHAVPAVLNYAGQVAVNGQPFNGQGLFKFALVNADGNTTYWSNDGTSVNGSQPAAHVTISVNGGLYSLLLGNTAMSGMGAIDPQVFAPHGDAKLRVWFSDGVNGFQKLSPDRPFTSVPYAFSAGTAQTTTIADGSLTASKIARKAIGKDQISDSILKYLKPEITTQPQTFSVFAGSNTSFSISAAGKYLSYQWKKNGSILTGETNSTLAITDANATQHDGNYSVVVSNDFGSVETNASGFQVINQNAITQGLVGWWPLDGNASDMSGNGNDGDATEATPEMDRRGVSGKAYYLDGVDDKINLGNSSILNPANSMTLSVWFKINSWKSSPIIERYHPTTGQRAYYLSLGNHADFPKKIGFRVFYDQDLSEYYSITSSKEFHINLNVYYHAAATYDSNSVASLYLDGQCQETKTVSLPIESSIAETTIGGEIWSKNRNFHGTIDEVRIYDRALSAAEVQALYNLGQ